MRAPRNTNQFLMREKYQLMHLRSDSVGTESGGSDCEMDPLDMDSTEMMGGSCPGDIYISLGSINYYYDKGQLVIVSAKGLSGDQNLPGFISLQLSQLRCQEKAKHSDAPRSINCWLSISASTKSETTNVKAYAKSLHHKDDFEQYSISLLNRAGLLASTIRVSCPTPSSPHRGSSTNTNINRLQFSSPQDGTSYAVLYAAASQYSSYCSLVHQNGCWKTACKLQYQQFCKEQTVHHHHTKWCWCDFSRHHSTQVFQHLHALDENKFIKLYRITTSQLNHGN
ncbi:hypothetical protein Q9233_004226 [Columba guinea]|nr:hypothetical protein Q9233_004226 [Columba guinea]